MLPMALGQDSQPHPAGGWKLAACCAGAAKVL